MADPFALLGSALVGGVPGAPGADGDPIGAGTGILGTNTSSAKSSATGFGEVNGAFTFGGGAGSSSMVLPIAALALGAAAIGLAISRR